MAYIPILDTQLDPDAPITSGLGFQFRDNPISIAAGDTGAPYIKSVWHPYDGVTWGDGNDGEIYTYTTGGVTEIVTPDFVDGYEYQLIIDELSIAITSTFSIGLYGQTSGSYGTIVQVDASVGPASRMTAIVGIDRPRETLKKHLFSVDYALGSASGGAGTAFVGHDYRSTSQKILKAKLVFGSAISEGRVRMYKRLVA